MRRRRTYREPARPIVPFTDEEDAKVVEITRIGLSSSLWHHALPGRPLGDILERRMQLQEQGLCPKTPTT